MRKTLATLALMALTGTAHARTFHYACKSGESRYALTVNTDRGIVKLIEHGPPHTLTTFRILKVATCGKYGWILNGATFCTATQGVGTLDWQGWGQENTAYRQIFTSYFIPGATPEQAHWFNELQRITTSPQNAARIRSALDDIDVTGFLSKVRVPTLVLHCRNDAVQPFEEGSRMAAGISGSRFVALECRNRLILEHEPAWARFREEVTDFLGR